MKPQDAEKKTELKKLFYTNLTSYEIQTQLNLSQTEYNKLLSQVKQELGLPTSFRRIPSKTNEYADGKYYIAHYINTDEFEILTYTPTKEIALELLKYFNTENTDDYFINKATEKHMLKLIEDDYFLKEQSWNTIMTKYKLSYHTFYALLNKIKTNKGVIGTRTGKSTRYIYKFENRWRIRKSVNGKQMDFGVFDDINIAMKIRDYLEDINWDKDVWSSTKKTIGEITE